MRPNIPQQTQISMPPIFPPNFLGNMYCYIDQNYLARRNLQKFVSTYHLISINVNANRNIILLIYFIILN